MSRRPTRLRHLLQSRIILVSVAFTGIALVAVGASFAFDAPILALLLVGSASLSLTLLVIALHQRNAPAVAKSLRRQDAKLLEIQRLLAQAELRCEHMHQKVAQEMTAELHKLNNSERLTGIESSLDALVQQVSTRPSVSPQTQASFSERDLEMFLVHVLATHNNKVR